LPYDLCRDEDAVHERGSGITRHVLRVPVVVFRTRPGKPVKRCVAFAPTEDGVPLVAEVSYARVDDHAERVQLAVVVRTAVAQHLEKLVAVGHVDRLSRNRAQAIRVSSPAIPSNSTVRTEAST
jgi:hypothetical protein